jgi:hypothetical protein
LDRDFQKATKQSGEDARDAPETNRRGERCEDLGREYLKVFRKPIPGRLKLLVEDFRNTSGRSVE